MYVYKINTNFVECFVLMLVFAHHQEGLQLGPGRMLSLTCPQSDHVATRELSAHINNYIRIIEFTLSKFNVQA